MKVSETWLRERCNPALSSDELGAVLTLAGLEVDEIGTVANHFDGVVVAHVVATKPHPQADRLTICDVDKGDGTLLQVVCGAANVRPDLKVALATIGARLSADFQIKETKLRGELSQGMLCSAEELGIDIASNGILELPQDAPIGMDVREYLQLDDRIFDIDLTPNRADCLSINGIAREVAALTCTSLTPLTMAAPPASHDEKRQVHIVEKEACPVYALRIIKGLKVNTETPYLFSERLRRAGVPVIHPIVDIVNYVMLELGQPMHAFDLSKIQGDISVRYAKASESLTLLNQQTVILDEKVLCIADENRVLAMAGVMGGLDSAVMSETVDILLESAVFNPVAIAGVARRFGLTTESAQRFERGVDPTLFVNALERVTELLIAHLGGHPGPVMTFSATDSSFEPKLVQFKPERFAQMTGVSLSIDTMRAALERLHFKVDMTHPEWRVEVPSYRFDISYDVDLIEEILRLHGYDKIEASVVMADMRRGRSNLLQNEVAVFSDFLNARGYHETISYSFVDPVFQRQLFPDVATISLLNPISPELSEMRVSLWPGLISSLLYNQNRQQNTIRCFEAGVVFEKQTQLVEHMMLAGVVSGETGVLNWCEPARAFDFFDLKGDLQAMFTSNGHSNIQFVSDAHPALHPGQTARIMLNNKPIGWIGALHPKLLDMFDCNQAVYLFEIQMAPFTTQEVVRYRKISKYPQIRRDLSLLVNQDIEVAAIEHLVRQVIPAAQLKSFDVFDQYMGEHVPAGKKSIAVALTLQSDERTLVDEEINGLIATLLSDLKEKFSIVLRE